MRTLVTGGSGFIGTNVVEHFATRSEQLVNLDVSPPRNKAHRRFWRQVDLRDANALRSAVRDFSPQIVVHLAARTDLEGRTIDDYAANTQGENLIAAIEGMSGVKRVIFASSRLVCRIGYQPRNDVDYCPTTVYGESKVAGETIVRRAASRIPGCWAI